MCSEMLPSHSELALAPPSINSELVTYPPAPLPFTISYQKGVQERLRPSYITLYPLTAEYLINLNNDKNILSKLSKKT